MSNAFLHVDGRHIVDAAKSKIPLRGVNLGGWLNMEGYLLHSGIEPMCAFEQEFEKKLGRAALENFHQRFRSNFITRQDIDTISYWGFNVARVPLHFKLIEDKPTAFHQKGLTIVDQLICWARQAGIYLILDLHAAPGCQNHDWHSDSRGPARLWTSRAFQRRTLRIWEALADRYKDEPVVAGYDLLNESEVFDTGKLNAFYHQIIKTIRRIDKKHILFVEGNKWATNIACLDDFDDDNWALSLHCYEPLDFAFNFVPGMKYTNETAAQVRQHVTRYAQEAKRRNRPVLVGEFGVNGRFGFFQEQQMVADMVALFKEFGFHWTYWTYKAVKGSLLPDGLFSYVANPAWVNRFGPKRKGWRTYVDLWENKAEDIAGSWQTENFVRNDYLIKALTGNGK